jgi:hypothetical protein
MPNQLTIVLRELQMMIIDTEPRGGRKCHMSRHSPGRTRANSDTSVRFMDTQISDAISPWRTFCTVIPNTCGSSVLNLLHVTPLAPSILWWLLGFWKTCALLVRITAVMAKYSTPHAHFDTVCHRFHNTGIICILAGLECFAESGYVSS